MGLCAWDFGLGTLGLELCAWDFGLWSGGFGSWAWELELGSWGLNRSSHKMQNPPHGSVEMLQVLSTNTAGPSGLRAARGETINKTRKKASGALRAKGLRRMAFVERI